MNKKNKKLEKGEEVIDLISGKLEVIVIFLAYLVSQVFWFLFRADWARPK